MVKSERVEAIDALRGVAALAVVLYHYVGFIPSKGIPVGRAGSAVVAAAGYGYLGVPIFFVLSGYVIAMTASRYPFTPGIGARFVLRRLVRLAPPYWAMVGLLTVAYMAARAAGYFKNTIVTPGQVLAHFAYAQDVLGYPLLDPAYWTLCLEVQFYLVFAATAVVAHRCRAGSQVWWFVALTVGSLVVNIFDAVPTVWFPSLWYQFGIGVVTYHAIREWPARTAIAALLLTLVGLSVLRGRPADATVALASGVLLFRGRFPAKSPARLGVLLGLGRISYSLYLVHGFIGIGLGIWLRSPSHQSETTAWIAIAAATVAALAFAAAFYSVCEQRAVEWSRMVRINPVPAAAPEPVVEALPDQAAHLAEAAKPAPAS